MTIQSDNTPEHLADTANQTASNKVDGITWKAPDNEVNIVELMNETPPKSIGKTLASIAYLILNKSDFSTTKLDAIIKVLLSALFQY